MAYASTAQLVAAGGEPRERSRDRDVEVAKCLVTLSEALALAVTHQEQANVPFQMQNTAILVSSIFTKKGCQICTYRVQDGPLVGSCLWYVAQTVSGCIFRLPKDHRHATEQGISF